jgi:hypothetical protein
MVRCLFCGKPIQPGQPQIIRGYQVEGKQQRYYFIHKHCWIVKETKR